MVHGTKTGGRKKQERIRNRILLPLGIALLLSALVTVFVSARIYRAHMDAFLLGDSAQLVALLDRLRLTLFGTLGLTAAGVFIFLYFFLGRIEETLLAGRKALMEEIAIKQRAESELRLLQEGLEFQVAERTKALTKLNETLNQDITQRKKAEEELRNAKEEWEQTFDAMGDIVTIQDCEMRIIRANRPAGEALGIAPEELVGRSCFEVFRGKSEPCPDCPEQKSLKDHRFHTGEIEHLNLGKVFLVSASPIINHEGICRGVVHVARDITRHRNLEIQLRQVQKMEAVGTLAAGVAHDFNNILMGIIGYSEYVSRNIAADSPLRQDLEQVVALGKRGASLTRQLLAFGRKQSIEMSVLSLNDLVRDFLKMASRLLREDVKVEFVPTPALWPVMADPEQLEQVLLNLVLNALDAMPNGGTLTIETANIDLDASHANRHMGVTPGAFVMLAVSDTGIGMSEETMAHIFEPFFTTKEVGQGTGLGLATVHGIIQLHHANILVSSQPRKGAVFKILLPRASETRMDLAHRAEHAFPKGQETVLLVEDEEAVRITLERTLAKLGYTVLVAADATEAEGLIIHGEKIDLLFTDLIMPGCNGMELYRRLAAKRPDLKVLFMSGYSEPIMQQKRLGFRGRLFLQKPFTPQKVAQAVRAALDTEEKAQKPLAI